MPLFTIICQILPENEKRWFDLQRQKILSIENNVRPNRDDSDHVLIITIDIDLESGRTIRFMCIKIPYITSHKIGSVASRSGRVMIILNKLPSFTSNSEKC
jgi:flagellar motor switch protein FliM